MTPSCGRGKKKCKKYLRKFDTQKIITRVNYFILQRTVFKFFVVIFSMRFGNFLNFLLTASGK